MLQLLRKTDPLVKTLEEAKRSYIMADLLVTETYKEISKDASYIKNLQVHYINSVYDLAKLILSQRHKE